MLAAHSAGDGNQPLQQLASFLVLSVAAAAAATAGCSWLAGDILQNVRACISVGLHCCCRSNCLLVYFAYAHLYHFPSIQGRALLRAQTRSAHPPCTTRPLHPSFHSFFCFPAQGGSAGIVILATVASLGSTAAFTLVNHNTLLRRAAAAGALSDRDDLDELPGAHAGRAPLMGPKEV